MIASLAGRTIRELHDDFDRKTISATELTRDFIAAARKDTTHAYLSVLEERALAQARVADETIAREGRVPLSSEFHEFNSSERTSETC